MKHEAPTAYESLIQFLYRAPIGLVETALDGEITMINPMAAQLLMPFAVAGNLENIFDVLATVAPDLRTMAAADRPGGIVCEGLRVPADGPDRRGGAPRWLEISALELEAGSLMVSVTDVTQTVQQEQQRLASRLRDAARTDSLTALPSRPVALERIAEVLARRPPDPGASFAVVVVDCDRFSSVNVNHGTAVGDELLRLLAGRINNLVRTGDVVAVASAAAATTAARLGGDEFVVVLDSLRRADDIHGVAQRLLDAIARPYAIGDHQIHVTASLGIVLAAQAAGDADTVLQDACIAMHEAKRAGGARYALFTAPMKEAAAHRARLESDLRRALDEHELFVVYQPIVGLARGECAGVEALVRWRHPDRGIVSPVEFIGIAEETGLIGQLGEFVLRTACRQFVLWQEALGALAPRIMSVNLSRAQLAEGPLADIVQRILAETGMAAPRLQLEVTESLAAQDEAVQHQLHGLKALGITLALDDFGTGYSSLASLHQLPVDVVKIDRSFVSQSEASAHHRVLIEATVRVARSLSMGTVAEGIETAGQARTLARLRCDKGQGYFFAQPMTAEDATRWMAARLPSDRWLAPTTAAAGVT
jgi:diguanylate cyclase (GGDEF)-like protein